MSSNQYLWHVTLSTGHTRRSYRHEISEEAIEACDAMLSTALQSDARAQIPGMPGYYVTGTGTRRNVLLTVWHATDSGASDPVLTMGIATNSRGGQSLWKLLTETSAIAVHPLAERCPPEPWVAARLEPAIVGCPPDVIEMIGDMERCLGWAWIERVSHQ